MPSPDDFAAPAPGLSHPVGSADSPDDFLPADAPEGVGRDDVDWAELPGRLGRMMRSRTGGAGAHPVEDLVQECIVRLLRFFEGHRARDLDRISYRIVDRVWKDHLRRRKVRGRHMVELDDESHVQIADPTAEEELTRALEVDRTRRLGTAILFFFEQDHPACHALALARMAGRNWAEVAAEIGAGHAAIRQQWSRCAHKALDFLRNDDGPLGRSLSVRA